MALNQPIDYTVQSYYCPRCGVEMNTATVVKRLERDSKLTNCADCELTGPIKQIRRGSKGDFCRPWHGEFDDNDNPMKYGRLYLPGERICGFRDCVNKKHVIAPEVSDQMKECSICGVVKDVHQFGIDRKKRDGLNCECKDCRRARDQRRALTLLQYGKTGETYNDFIQRIEKERVA